MQPNDTPPGDIRRVSVVDMNSKVHGYNNLGLVVAASFQTLRPAIPLVLRCVRHDNTHILAFPLTIDTDGLCNQGC